MDVKALDLLPPHVRQRADVTGSGELMWPPSAVADAIAAAVDRRLAILSVEAYGRLRSARGSFHREFPTRARRGGREPWAEFVQRSAAEALAHVESDLARHGGTQDALLERRYFLAVSAEEGYRLIDGD
jgi:hypothetical protein